MTPVERGAAGVPSRPDFSAATKSTLPMLLPNRELWRVDPGRGVPQTVRQVVETVKGSGNKYEYDQDLGVFRLECALYSPMHFPGDYGFVPGTIAESGGPIQVLAIVDRPSFPGCMFDVRPVGILDLSEATEVDRKILAVPTRDPRFEQIRSIEDVSSHVVEEIRHFFEIYKELEQKPVRSCGWRGVAAAQSLIVESRRRYQQLQER